MTLKVSLETTLLTRPFLVKKYVIVKAEITGSFLIIEKDGRYKVEVVSKINPCRDLRSSQFLDKNRLSKLKKTLSGPFLGKKIIDLRYLFLVK